jgi:DHA1 family tetracycline resistance protein-like MFS transporter
MIYAFVVPYCLGGIAGPAIHGIVSNQVLGTKQREIQDAITSLMSLTSIIGTIIMTRLFAYFTKQESPIIFPGAPSLLAAIFILISKLFSVKPLNAYHIIVNPKQLI